LQQKQHDEVAEIDRNVLKVMKLVAAWNNSDNEVEDTSSMNDVLKQQHQWANCTLMWKRLHRQ
jgi:hypothetical protein